MIVYITTKICKNDLLFQSMSVEFLLHRRYGYSFAFERPIKTRYVRIYSEFVDAVADEYVRCHTIELIGCLKHGIFTLNYIYNPNNTYNTRFLCPVMELHIHFKIDSQHHI